MTRNPPISMIAVGPPIACTDTAGIAGLRSLDRGGVSRDLGAPCVFASLLVMVRPWFAV
jgi:hypothetical protein